MNKGLEALEELRYRITNFNGKFNDYKKIMNTIEQELTALDAIKRNPMLIISLLTNNATYKYVVEVTNESERPTQEEWDLLKEVLS